MIYTLKTAYLLITSAYGYSVVLSAGVRMVEPVWMVHSPTTATVQVITTGSTVNVSTLCFERPENRSVLFIVIIASSSEPFWRE